MSATADIGWTDVPLRARVQVPQGVVYRTFVQETVILNLETGQYHGVNPIGGRMLDTLSKVRVVGEAAAVLARDFDRPLAEVEIDLCEFCRALIERGLLASEPA